MTLRGRLDAFRQVMTAKRASSSRERVDSTFGELPVAYGCDVCVVGGGVSGIAAAIASARAGASTILLEQHGALGGLVTMGLVTPFSMQMMLPDGTMITRGLVEELFDRLTERGGTVRQWRDWRLPKLPVDPEIFKLVVGEMLTAAGVRILLNTAVLDAAVVDERIDHLVIHNRSGLAAVRASMVVDCSGEADVARAAGVETTRSFVDEGSTMSVVNEALRNRGWVRTTEKACSLQFAVGGIDLDAAHDAIVRNPAVYASTTRGELVEDVELFSYLWREQGFFYLPHETSFRDRFEAAIAAGTFRPKIGRYVIGDGVGLGVDGMRGTSAAIVNANRILLDPFDEEAVTDGMLSGQEACFEIWGFLRDHVEGFDRSRITAVAPYLGIRRGAQIVGDYVFTAEERLQCLEYDDVIGMASRKEQRPYEVPFSLMLPRGVRNLLVASGKTVSCDDFLPYRVKPVCMILGQGAGTAAALCVAEDSEPRRLDIRRLQSALIGAGVYLGPPERLQRLGLERATAKAT